LLGRCFETWVGDQATKMASIKAQGTTGFRVSVGRDEDDEVVLLSFRTANGKEQAFALPLDQAPVLAQHLMDAFKASGSSKPAH
jgi:hypothetical protein